MKITTRYDIGDAVYGIRRGDDGTYSRFGPYAVRSIVIRRYSIGDISGMCVMYDLSRNGGTHAEGRLFKSVSGARRAAVRLTEEQSQVRYDRG